MEPFRIIRCLHGPWPFILMVWTLKETAELTQIMKDSVLFLIFPNGMSPLWTNLYRRSGRQMHSDNSAHRGCRRCPSGPQ